MERNERHDTMGTNVYSPEDNQSMHKSLNGEFLLYQILLQRILDQKPSAKFSKSSLSEYFKPEEKDDQEIMKEFDEKYQPEKAIHWYTRESCIYRMLNKALRTQNIDDLRPFGHLMRDLNSQLSQEHIAFIKKLNTSIVQLYRGQLIDKDELNRLKSTNGQLISMNSFLSTSTNRKKAVEFASRAPPNDQLTSILLEIDVQVDALTRPYADIRHLSAFSEEEEILFMFGCVFRIANIRFDEQSKLWIIRMQLCSENDPDMKDFSSSLDGDLQGQNQFISLGNYLIQMQKYEEAEKHFQEILTEEFTNDPIELAYCYHGLASVKEKKGDFNSAISNLNEVLLHLAKNSSTDDHPLVSQAYNDLASMHFKQENHVLAFQFYEKALKTKNNIPSNTYSGLAQIQSKLGNYILALEYFQKALDNQSRTAHASIADTFIQMGKVYAAMNNKVKASEMFEKAIQSQREVLHEKHPDVSYTYMGLSLMYSEMNDEEKAFDYIEKAHQLQMQSLPNNHTDFALTYKAFAALYMKKEDYARALSYYQQALANELKTLLWNHPTVAETNATIGLVYWKTKDYEQALICFDKVLQSELSRRKLGDTSLSKIYKNLADLNQEKGDIDQALVFYLQYLSNELATKFSEDISLADTYQSIGDIYLKKRRLKKALLYYNRLLDCHSQNKKMVAEVYQMIGKVYLKKRHFDRTLFYYQQLEITKDEDVMNIHFEQRHLDQVLIYFQKYLREQLKHTSKSDLVLSDTYQILGTLSFDKGNSEQALDYFFQLLNNQLHRKPIEDPSLADIYKIIGTIYTKQGLDNQSLTSFYRLIDCLNKSNHRSLTKAYHLIGQIYYKKDPLNQQPSNYMRTLIENKTSSNRLNVFETDFPFEKRHLEESIVYFGNVLQNKWFDSFTFEQILLILGNLHLEKQDFHRASISFQQLLHQQNLTNPLEYFSLGKTNEILANIYQKQSRFNQALRHYQQSLYFYEKIHLANPYLINNIKYLIISLTR